MIIPGQFGFNCPSGLRDEAFRNIFPIGSNVNLFPAVVAILDFRSLYKKKICRGPCNDHSWAVWFKLQVVSERKCFETLFP